MIVLHAELEDAEAAVGGRGEGTADGREDPLGSQATDRRTRAQGDVQGVRGGVRRPAPVRDPGAASRGGLAAGAGAAAAPGAGRGEGELPARHLDRGDGTMLVNMCQGGRGGVGQLDRGRLDGSDGGILGGHFTPLVV